MTAGAAGQRLAPPPAVHSASTPSPTNRDGQSHCKAGRRIRAPFDSEIISAKTTRHSNTIDNVTAKIDNVKAKIQDKEERRPWSRPTLARRPVSGQLVASPTSSPLEGSLRQVSASHDKSPPHTTSLRLTREVRPRLACGTRRTT
jgi:hypothetical protein